MDVKFVLVLTSALCLAQGLNTMTVHQKPVSQRDIIDDIFSAAVDRTSVAYGNLTEHINVLLGYGEIAVNGTATNAISVAKVLLQNAVDQAGMIAPNMEAVIEQLLTETSKDITSCVEGRVEQAQKIQDDTIANMNKCFADAEQLEADIKAPFNKVETEVNADVDALKKESLSCLPADGSIEHTLEAVQKVANCLDAVVIKLAEDENTMLAQIVTAVTTAEQQSESNIQTVTACLDAEKQVAVDKQHAIDSDIVQCVTDLP